METKYSSTKISDFVQKNSFELAAWANNQVVCGIDEVGRGCLAGPLVTAAVIIPSGKSVEMLKDSKILTERQKSQAYTWIIQNCCYGVGICDNYAIDKQNIWQATLSCMKKALIQLLSTCNQRPVSVLVDAMPLRLFDMACNSTPVYYFNKGEGKSCSIAAASIVAKVTRDEIMKKFEALFPGFGLAEHKGYGTKMHNDILKNKRSLIIHRKSFLNNINTYKYADQKDELDGQQSIIGF